MNKRSEGRRNYNRKVNGKGGSKQEEDKPCPDFVFFFSSLLAGASCITVWSMGRVSTGWCLFLKSDGWTEKIQRSKRPHSLSVPLDLNITACLTAARPSL